MRSAAYLTRTARGLVALFILVSLLFCTLGYLHYRDWKAAADDETRRSLAAIADLKVRQIAAWRKERIADGEVARAHFALTGETRRFMDGRAPVFDGPLLRWLNTLIKQEGFSQAYLIDRRGTIRLATDLRSQLENTEAEIFRQTLASGRNTFSELYPDQKTGRMHMDLGVPVEAATPGIAAGVLILVIDAQDVLFPLIQIWPGTSPTGESLLVRREGNQIVYLNELRHRPGKKPGFRLPLNTPDLPAAIALREGKQFVEGVDYRGVPVLATMKAVPDSPWWLVAKVDVEEIAAPIRSRFTLMAALVSLSILATAAVIGLLWSRMETRHREEKLALDVERKALIGHLHYLSEYANDIILLFGEHGNILEANDRAVSSYGYSKDELLGLNVHDLREPTTLADLPAQWNAAGDSVGIVFETLHQRKDGTVFAVEVSSRAIEAGGKKFRQSVIRNIEERKRAERELTRVNRALRVLSECSEAVIRVSDETQLLNELCSVIVQVGGYRIAWIGFPRDDADRSVLPVACAGIDQESLAALRVTWAETPAGQGPIATAIRTGQVMLHEHFVNDERLKHWRDIAVDRGLTAAIGLPLFCEGRAIGGLGIFSADPDAFDGEERKLLEELARNLSYGIEALRRRTAQLAAEDALRLSESRLARSEVIANLGTWEIELDPGTPGGSEVSCWWSDEVYRILGLEPGQLAPCTAGFLSAVQPADRDKVQSAYREIRTAGGRHELSYRIIRPGGETRWLFEVAEAASDADGRPVRVSGTVQDVTERKRLEEQFQQAQKLESVGRLAGGIAHDFNNLLTVINGYGDLLAKELTPPDPLHGHVVEIRNAGEKAARLTRQLLAVSRRQVIESKVLDLNAVIADTGGMLRRLLGDDIELETSLSPSLGRVRTDSAQMTQVLMNLAVNARDAMPKGGRLFIATANVELDAAHTGRNQGVKPGPYVLVTVRDTGTGMSAETQRHLFEPFFTTKPAGVGTGLGLATIYGIVRQHGGWIEADSEEGRGTTFRVYLPRIGDETPGPRA